MGVKPKNWLLLRGLAREERHWGSFPKMLEEQADSLVTHFLELPGVGKKANQEAFANIEQYTNQLRDEWLDLKKENEGDWGIMAISMGGMIGMDWCHRFPHDMKSLILINSSAGNLSPPHHRFSPKASGTVLKLFFREDYKEREEAILSLTTNMLNITPEVIDKYAAFSQESPIRRASFLKQMFAASRFKVPQTLKANMLIMAAKKDKLASYKCSQAIARHYEQKIYLHKEAGHDLPLDDPQWIIDHILKFLKV